MEGSALNGTSVSYTFLPKLRDHCRERGRKTVRTEEVDIYSKAAFVGDSSSVAHEFTVAVTACITLAQDQASQTPSMDGGGAHEIPLLFISRGQMMAAGVMAGEMESIFFMEMAL